MEFSFNRECPLLTFAFGITSDRPQPAAQLVTHALTHAPPAAPQYPMHPAMIFNAPDFFGPGPPTVVAGAVPRTPLPAHPRMTMMHGGGGVATPSHLAWHGTHFDCAAFQPGVGHGVDPTVAAGVGERRRTARSRSRSPTHNVNVPGDPVPVFNDDKSKISTCYKSMGMGSRRPPGVAEERPNEDDSCRQPRRVPNAEA